MLQKLGISSGSYDPVGSKASFLFIFGCISWKNRRGLIIRHHFMVGLAFIFGRFIVRELWVELFFGCLKCTWGPFTPPPLPHQSSDDAVSWLIPFVISFYLCATVRNGLPVYKELRYLAEVKRFSMAVMFLSDKDKKGNHCTFTVTAQPVLNSHPRENG